MDDQKKEFMRKAIELSFIGSQEGIGQGPFGAVIVKDGEIVGQGHNNVVAYNDPTAHAEVVAIRDACKKLGVYELQGCEIYTSCEPCPMCLSAIYWAKLGKIYYGNTRNDAAAIGFDDAFLYHEIPLPLSERKITIEPLARDEAQAAFVLWAKKENNED
ncbi:nucleoside deaminase [Emticicia sp. BO119]|uniref:nucleoside deaminase n=1 Tax=Emticicia sp. BO119 TaxID=2757768 RepID=UPI0015EFF692|nr:nucleoside deaminase [Emticicia sp. BO119]MBA4850232.1 nucleoside deaminase [Emticicia sp. BO119]